MKDRMRKKLPQPWKDRGVSLLCRRCCCPQKVRRPGIHPCLILGEVARPERFELPAFRFVVGIFAPQQTTPADKNQRNQQKQSRSFGWFRLALYAVHGHLHGHFLAAQSRKGQRRPTSAHIGHRCPTWDLTGASIHTPHLSAQVNILSSCCQLGSSRTLLCDPATAELYRWPRALGGRCSHGGNIRGGLH